MNVLTEESIERTNIVPGSTEYALPLLINVITMINYSLLALHVKLTTLSITSLTS
jgi:hypothetical protein